MNDVRILTVLNDQKIGACKVLLQMTVGTYLSLAKPILDKNEYQRRRVKDSKSVYSLLRDDLKTGCTIPSIVLAYRSNNRLADFSEDTIRNDIGKIVNADNLIILDGLQRTYCLIDVDNELSDNKDEHDRYLKNALVIECYVGIDKIGILYRMLTLNTGQTKMSLRHQIEILYSNFKNNNLNNIRFYTQVEAKTKVSATEFQFKDAIDCFYSYIERDPNGIERGDVLDNITNIENLSEENRKKDLFEELIDSYSYFLTKLNSIDPSWKCQEENSGEKGKDFIHLFNRSIPLSAYGASVGELKDAKIINNIYDIKALIDRFDASDSVYNDILNELIKVLSEIKGEASKIGKEQRWFYLYFFKALFLLLNDRDRCSKDFVIKAYQRYKAF